MTLSFQILFSFIFDGCHVPLTSLSVINRCCYSISFVVDRFHMMDGIHTEGMGVIKIMHNKLV